MLVFDTQLLFQAFYQYKWLEPWLVFQAQPVYQAWLLFQVLEYIQ